MTREDRDRWDEKWSAYPALDRRPSSLLIRYQEHLTGGDALDLACGLGQNALWLAEQGYRVTAVDISPVALEAAQAAAQARGLNVNFMQADLDTYTLPQEAFNVVTVFRFLDRRLFPAIEAALRPEGWLFYQTFNVRRLETRPDIAREFLVELGGLAVAFPRLRVVDSRDQGEVSHVVCRA